jgi:hypothetical protein
MRICISRNEVRSLSCEMKRALAAGMSVYRARAPLAKSSACENHADQAGAIVISLTRCWRESSGASGTKYQEGSEITRQNAGLGVSLRS